MLSIDSIASKLEDDIRLQSLHWMIFKQRKWRVRKSMIMMGGTPITGISLIIRKSIDVHEVHYE